MQRLILTVVTAVVILGFAGYTAGLFTDEVRKEESCVLCRATRFSGRRYGFHYEHIEEGPLTEWYRQNIDPQHGLDSAHPHIWQQSACTVTLRPRGQAAQYDCVQTAPLFLLRPDIEEMILEKLNNRNAQRRLIEALNDRNQRVSTERVRWLLEYYYLDQDTVPWPQWWKQHAADFGMADLADVGAAR